LLIEEFLLRLLQTVFRQLPLLLLLRVNLLQSEELLLQKENAVLVDSEVLRLDVSLEYLVRVDQVENLLHLHQQLGVALGVLDRLEFLLYLAGSFLEILDPLLQLLDAESLELVDLDFPLALLGISSLLFLSQFLQCLSLLQELSFLLHD
jgi:hypothetical protein